MPGSGAQSRECRQSGSAEAGTALEARNSAPCSSWQRAIPGSALSDGQRHDDDVSPHDSNDDRYPVEMTEAFSNGSSKAQGRPTGSPSASAQHASPANHNVPPFNQSRQSSAARADVTAWGPRSSSHQTNSFESHNSVTSSEGSWEQYTVSQQAQMLSSQQVSHACLLNAR